MEWIDMTLLREYHRHLEKVLLIFIRHCASMTVVLAAASSRIECAVAMETPASAVQVRDDEVVG
jgi:hypothetical protein